MTIIEINVSKEKDKGTIEIGKKSAEKSRVEIPWNTESRPIRIQIPLFLGKFLSSIVLEPWLNLIESIKLRKFSVSIFKIKVKLFMSVLTHNSA